MLVMLFLQSVDKAGGAPCHPKQLVEEAVRVGLDAIALTDHDGMCGVVRFSDAAREAG